MTGILTPLYFRIFTSICLDSFILIIILNYLRDRALRRVFGPKGDEVTGNGENCLMQSLVICTP